MSLVRGEYLWLFLVGPKLEIGSKGPGHLGLTATEVIVWLPDWLLQIIVQLFGLVTIDGRLASWAGCFRLLVRVLFLQIVLPLSICIFSLS